MIKIGKREFDNEDVMKSIKFYREFLQKQINMNDNFYDALENYILTNNEKAIEKCKSIVDEIFDWADEVSDKDEFIMISDIIGELHNMN